MRTTVLLALLVGCDPSGLPGQPDPAAPDTQRTAVGQDVADIVHTCDTVLPEPDEGELCTVIGNPSTATHVLIQGTVLTDLAAFDGGGVLYENVENGTITCTGCDCAAEAPESTLVVSCPDGVVSPGLVNAHDHLSFDLASPAGHGDERYDHRHDWRKGRRGHTRLPASGNSGQDAMLYGEIRMLLGGVTSVAGSASVAGLVRNLDDSGKNGGLGFWEADYRTFPLGDSDGTMSASGCSAYRIDSATRLGSRVYLPHVAEGIDTEARNEFLCLAGEVPGSRDLIAGNTSIVHGIGLTAGDIGTMAVEDAELVWSPRSNVSLYGETAPVAVYRSLGVDIALGTDWT
ncbi:MAG: amidohydrolase, partial [Myxococcales bacterium]|nr:amidohydrolase [Myxococcales bacterium]